MRKRDGSDQQTIRAGSGRHQTVFQTAFQRCVTRRVRDGFRDGFHDGFVTLYFSLFVEHDFMTVARPSRDRREPVANASQSRREMKPSRRERVVKYTTFFVVEYHKCEL